ncbi:uncharacterized protein CTRU02_209330 [Colletotrichum truncatum]|uniref:Uncharacterized protein n=1 Tax=Colletotrichum truncatum TaxID=5467 RepID=A0ACC3YS37_COLTU|nr:uncharacterized protein CTRU02_08595 [Colletotrichum truncatum]KAF6789896.1 hypothetical protein CTRU02_08595 [Colletotrichum truncatum]
MALSFETNISTQVAVKNAERVSKKRSYQECSKAEPRNLCSLDNPLAIDRKTQDSAEQPVDRPKSAHKSTRKPVRRLRPTRTRNSDHRPEATGFLPPALSYRPHLPAPRHLGLLPSSQLPYAIPTSHHTSLSTSWLDRQPKCGHGENISEQAVGAQQQTNQPPSNYSLEQGFQKVPPEIRDIILKDMDCHTMLSLLRANPWFHTIINASKFATETLVAHIMDLERSETENLGCFVCYNMRPRAEFGHNQPTTAIKYSDGRLEPYDDDEPASVPKSARTVSLRRFCMSCGVQVGMHRRGNRLISMAGNHHWVCYCQTLRAIPNEGADQGKDTCPRCQQTSPLRNPEHD